MSIKGNGAGNLFRKQELCQKNKYFAWRLLHGVLHVCAMLRRRGIQVDDICLVCGMTGESLQHTFIECHFSREVWMTIYPEFL